jgi:acyl transferase domain-containing protein
VSDGDESLVAQPSVRTKNIARSPIFVFTGQGAQWAEMGKKLIEDFPSFQDDIKEMDIILSRCNTPPSWNILGMNDVSKWGLALISII